jgi:hypothetical protein
MRRLIDTAAFSKADQHLQQLAQQAEEAHLAHIKAKHEQELLESSVRGARRTSWWGGSRRSWPRWRRTRTA